MDVDVRVCMPGKIHLEVVLYLPVPVHSHLDSKEAEVSLSVG